MQVLRSVDTIAEFILAGRPQNPMTRAVPGRSGACARRTTRSPSTSRNGSTSAASAARWRSIAGTTLPSRVEPTTTRGCSIRSIGPTCARRSSSSAGSPSDTRGSSRRSGTPVTKSDRTAIGTSGCTSSTARRSDAICARASARLNAAGVAAVRCFRAPEWSVNDRSLWALDVLVEEGFSARREHGAAEDGRVADLSAPSARAPHRRPGRFSRCRRSSPIDSGR